MSYRDDYREGASEFFWTLPRLLLGVFVGFVAVFLLLVVLTPLTIGFGWFSGEANLRSFNHVQATYREAYDDANSMDAIARNSCVAKQALADAKTGGDQNTINQRESQWLAQVNTYNRVKGEYDAYMNDHFRGGVIKPSNLPRRYPTIADKTAEVC